MENGIASPFVVTASGSDGDDSFPSASNAVILATYSVQGHKPRTEYVVESVTNAVLTRFVETLVGGLPLTNAI